MFFRNVTFKIKKVDLTSKCFPCCLHNEFDLLFLSTFLFNNIFKQYCFSAYFLMMTSHISYAKLFKEFQSFNIVFYSLCLVILSRHFYVNPTKQI